MKPDIEQLIKTLRLEKADFIPTAELGIHPKIKEQLIGRPILNLKDEIDFALKAGYDYVKLQPGADFNPLKIGVNPEDIEIKDDGTPQFNWASEGKGIITNEKEFENYRFPSKSDFDYSKLDEIKPLLPDGMGVIGQYGDIFTMTWEMMGFETFSITLFENPELISRLNNVLGELVVSMFEVFAQHDNVDIIWFSDDIAFTNGLMVSPDILDQYFFPWLKKIGDLAKKYNKPLIYHTDGVLYDVFDKIIDCGVDAIHPIEPKAMKIAEVKKKYGDKLCLVGHVDVDLLARGTPEQVRAVIAENIKAAGYNGGYVIGSGNSIPEYVNFDNYAAMLNFTKELRSL
ncbi:hypothetical protein MNBD_IGNAVI01-804 [hydrothermal vent metagenome]|uniref:Uroporphyrinogen decarboxylase (URO-D) domain-containing protein n=1 Tax=hydrothermal vent metagenome TaxID=652676 RepID=A0A3B1BGB6_9ZZZZ